MIVIISIASCSVHICIFISLVSLYNTAIYKSLECEISQQSSIRVLGVYESRVVPQPELT